MKVILFLMGLTLFSFSYGQDIKTVQIGNLEVMMEDCFVNRAYDIRKMNWEDAKKACATIGDGWRLPTKDELNILYENQQKIGGDYWNSFKYKGCYWSSTESDLIFNGQGDYIWGQWFDSKGTQTNGRGKIGENYCRCVRDL